MAATTTTARVIAGNYAITYTDLTPPSSLGGGLAFTTENQQAGGVYGRATVWNGPSHTRVDYHPAEWTYSYIGAGAGDQLVGGVYKNNGYNAALWNGTTPSSFVNLNPAGSLSSQAIATDGTRQAGYAQNPAPSFQVRAGFWSGTAASFVDLHPDETAISSVAYAIAGNQQGGMVNYNGFAHAALWSGTAASYTDLTPPGVGFSNHSEILAMTASQQAGYAGPHAGIWFGTAASFVDIHPAGAAWSEAHATIDTMQTGFAVFGLYRHAILWFGSATDYIDWQLALGPKYRESQAESVWTDGNTILVAGSAVDFPGSAHPVLWTLTVPEPSVVSLLGLAMAAFAAKRNWGIVRKLKWIAEPDGAANGSQPIRAETNRTSSAAGFRR